MSGSKLVVLNEDEVEVMTCPVAFVVTSRRHVDGLEVVEIMNEELPVRQVDNRKIGEKGNDDFKNSGNPSQSLPFYNIKSFLWVKEYAYGNTLF